MGLAPSALPELTSLTVVPPSAYLVLEEVCQALQLLLVLPVMPVSTL